MRSTFNKLILLCSHKFYTNFSLDSQDFIKLLKHWPSASTSYILWQSKFHQVDEKSTVRLITIWDQLSTMSCPHLFLS